MGAGPRNKDSIKVEITESNKQMSQRNGNRIQRRERRRGQADHRARERHKGPTAKKGKEKEGES